MRISKQFLITATLSIVSILALENLLILLFNDATPCFLHNSFWGNLLLWLIRIPVFIVFTTFFQQLFTPKFVSLKERMIERDESEAKEKVREEKAVKNRTLAFDL